MQSTRSKRLIALTLTTLAIVLAQGLATPDANAIKPAIGAKPPPSDPLVTLPDSLEFPLASADGKDYRILVAVPPGPPPPQGYGVLIVLDGNAYFGAAAQAMRMLQTFPEVVQSGEKQQAEPTLVVGVAYPGDKVLDGQRRSWDFLPPARNREHIARLRGAEPGGADAFVDFLVRTLRPALAQRYTLRDDRHTLAGHSLGGYFVLHALTREPDAFQRYVAISPSTWWDDLRLVEDIGKAQPGNGRLLLAMAQEESPGYPEHTAIMQRGAHAVRDALLAQPRPPGTFLYQEKPGEDHMTMPFAMMPAVARFAALP